LIYALHPSPSDKRDKDVLFQVAPSTTKGSDDVPQDLLKLLNETPYHPFNVNADLLAKSPVQLAEVFVLRRRTFVSPDKSYSIVVQNVLRHNGLNGLRNKGTTISLVAEKGTAERDVVHAFRRMRDLQAVVKAEVGTNASDNQQGGQRRGGAQQNQQQGGGRRGQQQGGAQDQQDLSGLNSDELKNLWQRQKKQTDRIHAAWIKALNNK